MREYSADPDTEEGSEQMPSVGPMDLLMRHISTCKKAELAALPINGGRYPFPVIQLIQQVTSDRLALAGEHLRAGDQLIFAFQFRSAISRYYYAMYHAARSVVYADTRGDDYEKHHIVVRHLPPQMPEVARREQQLTAARFLRNEADYDIYPSKISEWADDARKLSITAADFVQACEEFVLTKGYI